MLTRMLKLAVLCCLAVLVEAQRIEIPPLPPSDGPKGPPGMRPLHPLGPYDALRTSPYTFEVSSAGEAEWDMPIWIPTGRKDVTPKLAFTYRSRRESGLMGQGFDVNGLSSVTRCWKTAAQDGHFCVGPTVGLPDVYCLDGQRLVPHGSAQTELQPEFDSSVLVRVNGSMEAPSSFDVYRPSGQVWRYGSREDCPATSQSQVRGMPLDISTPTASSGLFTTDDFNESIATANRTISWNVDRVEDHWGNYFDVDYVRSYDEAWSVEVAPGAMTWTGFKPGPCSTHPTIPPSRRIVFVYEQNRDGSFAHRLNPRSTYTAGIRIQQTFLLAKLVVEGPDALVSTPAASRTNRPFREYRMAYQPRHEGTQLLDKIDSITECIYNSTDSIQCREPIAFSWTKDNPTLPEFLPSRDPAKALADDPSLDLDFRFDFNTGVDNAVASELGSVVGDFNGDGRDDYLYRTLWLVQPLGEPGVPDVPIGHWYLRLGTPTGLGPRHEVYGLPVTDGGDPRFSPRALDGDFNGRAELLIYSEDAAVQQTRTGPSLTSYSVTDTLGYDFFTLQVYSCETPPFFKCYFEPRNVGERKILHPMEFVPRNSIGVEIGDLDGDGKPDLTRDDSDCPFSTLVGCTVFSQTPPHTISAGFRPGISGNPWAYGPSAKIKSSFPSIGPFTSVVFKQFEGRYLVDIDGNGQQELLTSTYNFVPVELSTPYPHLEVGELDQFPFALSALFFGPNGDGGVRTLPVALSARPLAMSSLMQRLRGPCSAPPFEHFGLLFLDVNGDGLSDAVSFSESGKDPCSASTNTTFLSINVGGQFRAPMPLPFGTIGEGPKLNQLFTPARGYDSGVRIADLDGDKRTDLVYFGESGVFWLKSTGDGFQSYRLPVAGSNGAKTVPGTHIQYSDSNGRPSGFGPRLSRLGDFNGDGVLDLVTLRDQWVPGGPGLVPGGPAFSYLEVNLGAARGPDMVDGIYGGHLRPTIRVHYEFARVASSNHLYQVTGSSQWPQTTLKKLGWVVSDYSEEAGEFASSTPLVNVHRFQYFNGRRDVTGRGFLGVERLIHTVTDDADTPKVFETEIIDYDHSIFNRVCRTELQCIYPFSNNPIARLDVVPIDNSMYRVKATRRNRAVQPRGGQDLGYDLWEDSVVEDTCDAPSPPQSTAAPCSDSVDLLSSRRTTRYFDQYGNVVHYVGELSSSGSLMLPGPAPPTFREDLTARRQPLDSADASEWLTARYSAWDYTDFDPTLPPTEQLVKRVITRSYEPKSVEVSRITIQTPSAPAETDATSGFWNNTTFERSPWGTVQVVKETASGSTRQTTIEFADGDSDRIFPNTIVNSLGHVTRIWPHATLGVPYAIDDPNMLRTQWDYDALGRAVSVTRAGSAVETFEYRNDLLPSSGLARRWTFAHRGGAIPDETASFDPLGLRVESTGEEFDKTSRRTFTFDRFGRMLSLGYPVDAATELYSHSFVEFERDGIGRLTKVVRPGNKGGKSFRSEFQYDGRETTFVSERGVVSKAFSDTMGRIVHIQTINDGRSIDTDLDYWHFDLLRHIHAPALPPDQAMTPPPALPPDLIMTYDELGRLESIKDPDIGYRLYFYNGFGELKRTEDANGGITTLVRDGLGRIRHIQTAANSAYPARQAAGSWALDTTFVYDTGPHGIGKLSQVVSADGISKEFLFDANSRLATANTTDETGQRWMFGYEYNPDGLLSAINYPPSGSTPFRVEYEYASNGETSSVLDASSPTRSLLWKQISRTVADQTQSEQFGSTELCRQEYEESLSLRLQSCELLADGEPRQAIEYEWGEDSLLNKKTDLLLGLSETYKYDALRRLRRWDVIQSGGETSWQYDYDDWGNIRKREVVGGIHFDATTYDYTTPVNRSMPHAAKSATMGVAAPLQFTYLPAGELRTGSGNAFTWTPLGLPATIASADLCATLLYDGFGQRVVRADVGADTTRHVTVDGLFEFDGSMGSPLAAYTYGVTNGSVVVAQVRRATPPASEQIRFVHVDSLGSPDLTDVTITGKGDKIERSKFEPFGERRSSASIATPVAQRFSLPSDPGFTGHPQDSAFGLVNMGGRLYEPGMSRFISPDPVGSFYAPSLNRYSYVWNSPVSFRDPSGFQGESGDEGATGNGLPEWCTGGCYYDESQETYGLDLSLPPSIGVQTQTVDENSNVLVDESGIESPGNVGKTTSGVEHLHLHTFSWADPSLDMELTGITVKPISSHDQNKDTFVPNPDIFVWYSREVKLEAEGRLGPLVKGSKWQLEAAGEVNLLAGMNSEGTYTAAIEATGGSIGIKRGLPTTGRSGYFGVFGGKEVVKQNGNVEVEPVILVEGGFGLAVVGAYQTGLSPDANHSGLYLGVRFGSRAFGFGLNGPAALPEAFLTDDQRSVYMPPDF